MQNVQARRATLWDFLEEKHLTPKVNATQLAQLRSHLERSPVLDKLRETAAEINRKVDSVVIEVHTYLPPEPMVSSFTYTDGNVEYIMQLEVCGSKPSLVFVIRKWRTGFSARIVDWTYSLFDADMSSIQIKAVAAIDPEALTKEDAESCFIYLLSGMRRSDFPSTLGYSEM